MVEQQKTQKDSKLTLWGAETPRTFRPIWVAEELSLAYHHQPIGSRTGETRTTEYTTLNPKQKIPLMQDGELCLSESLAICRYLVGKHGNQNLRPPNSTIASAKEDEWCCYIYGELDETALYVMRRHSDLSDIYGQSEAAVNSSTEHIAHHFAIIDDYLAKNDYLMPTGFTLADILLVSCIDWAVFYQLPVPSAMQAYRDRLAQRPAYQKAMQINYPILFANQL